MGVFMVVFGVGYLWVGLLLVCLPGCCHRFCGVCVDLCVVAIGSDACRVVWIWVAWCCVLVLG